MQEASFIFVKRIFGTSLAISSTLLLISCDHHTVKPTHGIVYDQIRYSLKKSIATDEKLAHHNKHLPRGVQQALEPVFTPHMGHNVNYENHFDVAADEVPAKTFLAGLVEGTPYNMVIDPNIKGTITLKLKDVTVKQVLQTLREVYGFDFRKTSKGYQVYAPEMQTQIFNVNYLDIKRKGKTLTEMSSGQISDKVGTFQTATSTGSYQQNSQTDKQSGSSVDTTSEMDFWRGLEATIKSLVGTKDGRSVVVNQQAGVIIIHAMPRELRHVARYLDRIQSRMGREVVLEAKILEVELDDSYQAGINWNAFGVAKFNDVTSESGISQTGLLTFEGTDLKDFNSIFLANIGGRSFNLIVKLLQTQGNVQVLSSPRLSTVNNQKAVIKVGRDEFFVTGVSTQNTVIANNTLPTQDVTLTPFFSGVTFDVTPQISNNDTVILHIHPSVSEVKDQEKNILLGATATGTPNILRLPLALSSIRESDNIVRAKNGEVIVIGGLMQNRMIEEVAGVPGVSKMPVIGSLFRRTRQVSRKTELVILLRPIVVAKRTWIDQLDDADRSYRPMRRSFHYGGLPKVFGNEGEHEDFY